MSGAHPIKQLLSDTREYWDHEGTPAHVRETFWKILKCRTGIGNFRRVGSCTTCGAESSYLSRQSSARSRPAEGRSSPTRLATVGERDDEAVRRSKDVYGRAVDLAGLPTQVRTGCRNPEDQPANSPVIRLVKAILIFASHRFRNRIMRTPEATIAMTKMAAVLMGSLLHFSSSQRYATAEPFSTDCFGGANASKAIPITTRTAEPTRNPTRSPGISSP